MSRLASLAALASLALAPLAGSAMADPPRARVMPAQPYVLPRPDFELPRFGFESFNIRGVGERVTYVGRRGLAARMGLEPGDTILHMNGHRLNYHGSWNDALREAMWHHDGHVRLTIRDVRTGRLVEREVCLGGGLDPIDPIGPITPKYREADRPRLEPPRPMPRRHETHFRPGDSRQGHGSFHGPSREDQLKAAVVTIGVQQLNRLLND